MGIERGHSEEQRTEADRLAERRDLGGAERKADELAGTRQHEFPDSEPPGSSKAERKAEAASQHHDLAPETAPASELRDRTDVARPDARSDIPGGERFEEVGARVGERLTSERWELATMPERETIAREVHDVVRSEYRLPPDELAIADLPPDTDGEYRPDERSVWVDRSLLQHDRPDALIGTIAHENRHDVQQRVMDGDMAHPHGAFGRRETELWTGGVSKYEASGLFADYAYNPIETDARAAGAGVTSGWLRSELDRVRSQEDPS